MADDNDFLADDYGFGIPEPKRFVGGRLVRVYPQYRHIERGGRADQPSHGHNAIGQIDLDPVGGLNHVVVGENVPAVIDEKPASRTFGVLMGSELGGLLLARFDVNDTELRFRKNSDGVLFVLGSVSLLRSRERENQHEEHRNGHSPKQKAGRASDHRPSLR